MAWNKARAAEVNRTHEAEMQARAKTNAAILDGASKARIEQLMREQRAAADRARRAQYGH